MVYIDTIVFAVFLLLACAAVVGLLMYAVNYCEKEFPQGGVWYKMARLVIVLGSVLFLICLVMEQLGRPIILWRK